jgi:hypothetical protein
MNAFLKQRLLNYIKLRVKTITFAELLILQSFPNVVFCHKGAKAQSCAKRLIK